MKDLLRSAESRKILIMIIGIFIVMGSTTKQIANCAFVMAFYVYIEKNLERIMK